MNRKRLVLLLLVLLACKPSPKHEVLPSTTHPSAPRVRATIVTIRTTIQPARKTLTHTLTFTTGRARSSDEVDSWRLFDLKQNRVTFVDDIARTYRIETAQSLLATRRQLLAAEPPETAPRVTIVATGAKRNFVQGIEASQFLIAVGAYRRELWIAPHSAIPPDLFAIMLASEVPSSPLAGMTRAVDETLLGLRGFPMLDHTELALDHGATYVIDRAVVGIQQQDVPVTYLNVGPGYKELAATEPAGNRPRASSRPRDRSTRAAE